MLREIGPTPRLTAKGVESMKVLAAEREEEEGGAIEHTAYVTVSAGLAA